VAESHTADESSVLRRLMATCEGQGRRDRALACERGVRASRWWSACVNVRAFAMSTRSELKWQRGGLAARVAFHSNRQWHTFTSSHTWGEGGGTIVDSKQYSEVNGPGLCACAPCVQATRGNGKHSPNLLLHLHTEGNVGEVEGREPAAVTAEHNPTFGVAATAAASERLFRHGVVLVIKWRGCVGVCGQNNVMSPQRVNGGTETNKQTFALFIRK
jgi:hypothetical protein